MCDSKSCTHKINRRRDVPNPLLCGPCTKWQEDNHHRFGDFYLNKQWQLRPFVSKNGPSEDPPRGRKKARFEERDKPSRRPSEDARSRKEDKRSPKGYSDSMVAEVSAQVTKTVLQALKADKPQRDRSRSRSRSTDRANRRFRRDHSSDEDSEEEQRRRRQDDAPARQHARDTSCLITGTMEEPLAALRAQISRRRKGMNPNPLISREMDDDRLKVRSDITFCTMLHLLGDAASRRRQRKQIRKSSEWRVKVTVKQAR